MTFESRVNLYDSIYYIVMHQPFKKEKWIKCIFSPLKWIYMYHIILLLNNEKSSYSTLDMLSRVGLIGKTDSSVPGDNGFFPGKCSEKFNSFRNKLLLHIIEKHL